MFQNCVLMVVMLRFCYTHTHTHKIKSWWCCNFVLKVNPLDYHFSLAAVLFISSAANIRICTQNFSMYAEKKIQYNLLIISTVRELSVLCMVQTAVLLQWGFVYNKITSWSKGASTESANAAGLSVIPWWLPLSGPGHGQQCRGPIWPSWLTLSMGFTAQRYGLMQLLSDCRGAEEDANVGCCMHTHVRSMFNKALSGVFLLILRIFPCSSQVERSISMQQVPAVSQILTCH